MKGWLSPNGIFIPYINKSNIFSKSLFYMGYMRFTKKGVKYYKKFNKHIISTEKQMLWIQDNVEHLNSRQKECLEKKLNKDLEFRQYPLIKCKYKSRFYYIRVKK